MDGDELDPSHNHFLHALINEFSSIWKTVEKQRYLVLVPRDVTLHDIKIDKKLILEHVFRPSPFVKDEWTPLSDQMKAIKLASDAVKLLRGYSKTDSHSIVCQETFYNGDMQSFPVKCIDHPIGRTFKPPSTSVQEPIKSLSDLEQRLNFISTFSPVQYRALQSQIDDFASRFVACKTCDVVEKINEIIDFSSDAIIEHCQTSADPIFVQDPRFSGLIHEAVGTVVIQGCYRKIYSAFEKELHSESISFAPYLHYATQAQPDELLQLVHVKEEHICDLTRPSTELAKLPKHRTIPAKIKCISETIKLIIESVKTSRDNYFQGLGTTPPSSSVEAVTSDDLIPLVSACILKAGLSLPHIEAQLLKDFSNLSLETQDGASQASFDCVTFEAAVSHLNSSTVIDQLEKHRQDTPSYATQRSNSRDFDADHITSRPKFRIGSTASTTAIAQNGSTSKQPSKPSVHSSTSPRLSRRDEDTKPPTNDPIVLPEIKTQESQSSDDNKPELGPSLSRLAMFGF